MAKMIKLSSFMERRSLIEIVGRETMEASRDDLTKTLMPPPCHFQSSLKEQYQMEQF